MKCQARRQQNLAEASIEVRYGIRLPKIMIDECLLMIIVAGLGLAIAYLRAEYVLHRGLKAADHEKLSEFHASRLRPKQIDVPVVALRNHQPFISNESALFAPDELPSTVRSGIARHRELA